MADFGKRCRRIYRPAKRSPPKFGFSGFVFLGRAYRCTIVDVSEGLYDVVWDDGDLHDTKAHPIQHFKEYSTVLGGVVSIICYVILLICLITKTKNSLTNFKRYPDKVAFFVVC